jgi:hypothetical protein
LDETLVNPALTGQDLFAELFTVVLAREVQGPVQMEVIGLEKYTDLNFKKKNNNIIDERKTVDQEPETHLK